MASEFGQVHADGGECLKYPMAIRCIVERHSPIGNRIAALGRFIARPEWMEYWEKSGGADGLKHRFFPLFLDSIPRLARSAREKLWELGLRTPKELAQASDGELMAIQGIGASALRQIRTSCVEGEPGHDERLEKVMR
jgi:hypothetical protein